MRYHSLTRRACWLPDCKQSFSRHCRWEQASVSDDLHPGVMPEPSSEVEAILSLLRSDERVRAVTLEDDQEGRLIARVVPAEAWLVAEREAAHNGLSSRILRQWKMVYDRSYRQDKTAQAPTFNAWISSFTGAAISPERMQRWLDGCLAYLRKAPHARVLDIGCGVGLVLEALAPDSVEYYGIDMSEEAIKSLTAWVATQPNLRHVRLARRSAHELDDVAEGSVDLVVLNSVIMYFPDRSYLLSVIRAASKRLAPGGRIFLGDLRALWLLPVLVTAIEVARATQGATVGDVRSNVSARLSLMRELAVDTSLFADFAAQLPGLSDVRFGLKPASADHELSGYRYDAVLIFDGARTGDRSLPT